MRKVGIVIAVVLTVICGGLGWTAYQWFDTFKELDEAAITQTVFDAQKEGTAQADVLKALPEPLTDIDEKELGRDGVPTGASCVYYTIDPMTGEGPDLFRFCFADGKLAEKSAVTIPATN
ncbi:MAG TPA: hypothetical protein VN408_39385 [Actinoplanes sp.]|nr:hypothetical protein [Actinoplanes sp.]